MLIGYDREADALYIRFASGKPRESVEVDDGVIVDIGENGEILGIKILAFSKRNIDLNKIIVLPPEKVIPEIVTGDIEWPELGTPSMR